MAIFWLGLLVFGFLGSTTHATKKFNVIDISQTSDKKCEIRTNFQVGSEVCRQRNYFIAHGWFESVNVIAYHLLMEKLKTQNVNVFFVNWKDIAGNTLYHRISVDFVGKCLAKYLRANVYAKCRKPYVHLIGHSLGAHVMGNAGRNVQKLTSHHVDVITALDAAGPGFYLYKKKMRLSPSDAKHVVQLITNGPIFGTNRKLGHVVFYANGGMFQPGCPSDNDITTSPAFCSHQRSVSYTIEAVLSNRFVAKRCGKTFSDKGPDTLVYNLNVPKHARGTYCFKTSHEPPYGLGYVNE